jgi:predicted helicase
MLEALLRTYLAEIESALRAGNATEHTHRPALKVLLEKLAPGIIATNEPKRISCGAPDYIITRGHVPLGYIEAKDVGLALDSIETDDQLTRYRAGLANLVLTDYLEFRWYVGGEHRLTARLAKPDKASKLKLLSGAAEQFSLLISSFFNTTAPIVSSPRDMAIRMASMARLIRSIISSAFNDEGERGELHGQFDAFREVLLHDLAPPQFADMYAQTICYGLFAARCNAPDDTHFSRGHAAHELPKTNPFLRRLFNHIAGPDLDDRIAWIVDDLVELLARADIASILSDFGKHTRQEDPVVHFYETFLAAYDPKMREARGVYYTPEPVVEYIVRSVNQLLKREFGLKQGLADTSMVTIANPTLDHSQEAKLRKGRGGKSKAKPQEKLRFHRVQILDPATGTGTFLYKVIDHIRAEQRGNEGMWSGYVREHLLPRLYGFEILMAPYAVAHLKLGLQLKDSGYDFSSDERLRVFLTNSLEEAHEMTALPLFTQWLANEANAAAEVKSTAPIMVVLGNPPYSNFGMMNKSPWILSLLKDYKDGLNEKKLNLDDDFIKFIRFAQWRIEQTGYGILAFVTNHTYIDGLTHRRMRESLMQTFNDIYVLDLHGNSKKKERTPGGTKDENVFDIQQGVAIGIFIKRGGSATEHTVRHADLWGTRESKYQHLSKLDFVTTNWQELRPEAPHYYFVPKSSEAKDEYEKYWPLPDVFPTKQNGIKTDRDDLFYDFDRDILEGRMQQFYGSDGDDTAFRERYGVKNSSSYDLLNRRSRTKFEATAIHRSLYRPFDSRWLYYKPGLTSRPAWDVMKHLLGGENLAIITTRQTADAWSLLATRTICGHKSCAAYDINTVFPLYLHLDESDFDGLKRHPNLAPGFIKELTASLELHFVPDGSGDLRSTVGPKDVFDYAYAVFHSPTYRNRYSAFLKSDFPRLPLTANRDLFRRLCAYGKRLVSLHLMEEKATPIARFPVAGDNRITTVRYDNETKRIWLNATQYFDNVPANVWQFHVGGYQVCEKWLKDRKGHQLSYDSLTHYQDVIAVINETIEIQSAIDGTISDWPVH